jgi:hypothetical protein
MFPLGNILCCELKYLFHCKHILVKVALHFDKLPGSMVIVQPLHFVCSAALFLLVQQALIVFHNLIIPSTYLTSSVLLPSTLLAP